MKKILVSVGKKHSQNPAWNAIICENYINWIKSAFKTMEDMEIVAVDPTDLIQLDALLPSTIGIVLTGGVDIDPSMYEEKESPMIGERDTARDSFEKELFNRAHDTHIPILGICRGLQLTNVCLGGKLIQHIGESHKRIGGVSGHDAVHPISILPGSRFKELMGTDTTTVNSSHHQAADPMNIASSLTIAATSKGENGEDIVEVLEQTDPTDGYMMLVQWHPERIADSESSQKILEDFKNTVIKN